MSKRSEIIEQVLDRWTAEFLASLQSSARRLPTDTGTGARSFSITSRKEGQDRAQVMLQFQSYLRYFDMRNSSLRRDKDFDPHGMERVKDWVRRNLSKLMSGYTGPTTYKYKEGFVPEKQIINNIAWGISKKRSRLKRRQWYVKLKGSQQYRLYYELLDELMPVMLEEAKSQLKLS